MTKQVQRRRGTNTQHTGFTGADGEISVNTTNKSIHVHDGATAGGFEAARADLLNVDDADVATAISGGTVPSLTITSADINGGTIDGTTIGANSAAAGTFTNLTSTGTSTHATVDINGGNIDGTTIGASSAAAITGTTITGTSFVSSGDMTFGDNDKAVFGAGSDLQIFGDGSDSYISEGGTGDLKIQGANVRLENPSGVRYFQGSSGVSYLYNSGDIKLNTTATGVDVNGTMTADGLTVDGTSRFNNYIDFGGTISTPQTAAAIYRPADNTLAFSTANTERMRIDSSGNVGIGTSNLSSKLTIEANNAGQSPTTSTNAIRFVDTDPSLVSNQPTGSLLWETSDTSDSGIHAYISTASLNTGAASLVFGTGTATSLTERMRIDSSGNVDITQFGSFPGAGNTIIGLRLADDGRIFSSTDGSSYAANFNVNADGEIIRLRHAGVTEGTITVSGTTVSYNGGHLARWSQLTDGTKDETIVKGTVLTNLDQMAVWNHEAVAATYYVEGDELPEITPATYYTEDDTLPEGVSVGDEKTAAVYAQIGDEKTPAADAYTEDNEQLNCMAVSSVEGDPNVAGVFVNWDNDDDEFNDMNIAMTGDMVIRIAQGTTVARGDLLMSAGDGTAKPQGDNIVRSKTIAKVTSTHVSHTYDDGSYLVPCVLMAC